ncbi:MAG: hypothetical protein H8E38_01365 [SAR324 cluster bacterium]|nr:hypothetical protein [SAR324 cluster bacterium]MBL7034603.1 hypothetical protein [SAR324 cluster bacterium]
MRDSEKKTDKENDLKSVVKYRPTGEDLNKKAIRVRKKGTVPVEEKKEISKYQERKESKYQGEIAKKPKPKFKDNEPLPWKKKNNVWSEPTEEYTIGPPPKSTRKLKQKRAASKTNLSVESFGEQGKLMLEALRIPEKKGAIHELTQSFHPYPGRFHPDLPKILLKQFPAGSLVFDPFMGGGTVLLEGLLWQHQVLGNDLNPIASMVARERCRWISEKNAGRVWNALVEVRERVKTRSLEKRNVQRKNITWLNKFHPPYLFVELLHWIDGIESVRSANERETLRAVFSSLITKFSNKLSETSKFSKAPAFPKGAVGKWMERKTQELLENQLALAKKIPKTIPALIWNKSILDLEGPEENSINCTITSPPYPGSYDYLAMHELRMKWLEFPTKDMFSNEIAMRNYTPKQWKQVFREFMLKLRLWTAEDGVCYLVLGDWIERNKRVSGLEFTQKYADSVGWKVAGSASVQHEIFDVELGRAFGAAGKWEHLILLRQKKKV